MLQDPGKYLSGFFLFPLRFPPAAVTLRGLREPCKQVSLRASGAAF